MLKLAFTLALVLTVTPAFARRHHRPVPPRLFPTAGSLARQNEVANGMGLPRVTNRAMLSELVTDGSLAPLPISRALKSTVPPFRAYLRPEAAGLLADLSTDFYEIWNKPLTVDSAVRPLDVQRRLWRSRRVPAAPPTGPVASVHPTGLAFDIGKKSLTAQQRRWLEFRLFYWQAIGAGNRRGGEGLLPAIMARPASVMRRESLHSSGNAPVRSTHPFFSIARTVRMSHQTSEHSFSKGTAGTSSFVLQADAEYIAGFPETQNPPGSR